MMKAKISEIFESIQGEGIYQGLPQIFIRFYGCNLKCVFCDTLLKNFVYMDTEAVMQRISRCRSSVHSIALTGGEPLLQKDFLKELLPVLKSRGFKVYLETNGTLYQELAEVLEYLDIIAMDIKLPSSTALKDYWKEHERFLQLALKKDVFIKTVVSNSTQKEDLYQAIRLVLLFSKDIPFVIQPEYDALINSQNGFQKKIDNFKSLAEYYLRNVKIIGQLHKFKGVR